MSDAPDRIGDYAIEAELGAGGMATVYRARHVVLDTLHALKVLDPAYRARPEARRRFLDEAKLQAKHLVHPNIVKVTNIVATPEHAALVMELVDGGNLETELGRLRDRPAELRRIMRAVLDAVGHAHAAGVIHRDLKPANVLLAREGGALVPKVTDFGIAKVSAELAGDGGGKRSTLAESRMGTLGYMSPEQIRRAKDVTAQSDIFSLGAMLYELATGAPAFAGDSDYDVMENVVNGRFRPPEEVYPAIDPTIAAVIRKALAPRPEDRFASCAEMAAALGGAAASVGERGGDERGADDRRDADHRRDDRRGDRRGDTRRDAPRRALVIGGIAIAGVAFATGALLVSRDRGAGGTGGRSDAQAAAIASPVDAGVSPTARVGDAGARRPPSYAEAAAAAMAAQDAPVDAGVFTRVVPLFPDAGAHGRLDELRVHDGIDAGTGSRLDELRFHDEVAIDAGSARSRLEALLGPDAGAPPPPNPCRGTWFFGASPDDWTVAINARSTGACGEIYFYDRTVTTPGVRTCRAQLQRCAVTGRTLTASFGCVYNVRPSATVGGTLTHTCAGGSATLRTPLGTRRSN